MSELATYVTNAAGLLGFLFGVYTFFRRESSSAKEKREAESQKRDDRLKVLEGKFEGHEIRFTGFNQEHERHCDAVDNKFRTYDQRFSEMQSLREDFMGIKAKVEYMAEGFGKLESKIDRLLENQNRNRPA